MSRAPTLRDVAEKAGVHHTTASRALRGHSGIPAVTRDRLRALSAEMGYRANPLVSAWMSHRPARPAAGPASPFLPCITIIVPLRAPWFIKKFQGQSSDLFCLTRRTPTGRALRWSFQPETEGRLEARGTCRVVTPRRTPIHRPNKRAADVFGLMLWNLQPQV